MIWGLEFPAPLPSREAEISAADLVATFSSGWRLEEVQSMLRAQGLLIPLGGLCLPDPAAQSPVRAADLTLEQAIGFDFPHALGHLYGGWTDWVLGLKVEDAASPGSEVKLGSRVVKSVAGYDGQKLFCGALGAFGRILSVTLRVYPLSVPLNADLRGSGGPPTEDSVLHRVRPADLAALEATVGKDALALDRLGAWAVYPLGRHEDPPIRFAGDQLWRYGQVPELNPAARRLMTQAKAQLDPNDQHQPALWRPA